MSELHFDIDVVSEPPLRSSTSWRRSARQIVVALCGAGILAGAMPVLSRPLSDDDDIDIAVPHHHHRAHRAPAPIAAPLNTATATTAFDEEPVPLAELPTLQGSERVRRQRARNVAEKSLFLHVLARVGASEPEVREKQAAVLDVPLDNDVVERKFDAGDVGFAMSQRSPAFQACYERALKKNARLAGNYRLSFTVNAKGDVKNARVMPRDGDGLSRCLQSVVNRMRFSAPPSPVDVSRKLTFRAPTT